MAGEAAEQLPLGCVEDGGLGALGDISEAVALRAPRYIGDLGRRFVLIGNGTGYGRWGSTPGGELHTLQAVPNFQRALVSPDGEAVPTEPSPTVEQVVLGYLAAGRHPIAVAA